MLIHVLLVVCHDRLGDGLSDSVDLRCVTTAGNAHSDINTREFVNSDDQEGLVDLCRPNQDMYRLWYEGSASRTLKRRI
jgi:hypothetical protein